jgi:AcrR family transcriptional regulator
MPAIAQAALVSEPTAYRYFPDLLSLLTEALCRHVLAYQGAVRAMIAATITRPELAQARPGLRLGLIHHALAPLRDTHRHNAHHRGDSWLYESRFDGLRGLLWRRSTDIVELLSRNLRDLATCFPELVEAGHARPAGTLVDAAIVIAESRWQFGLQSLQHRLATRGRTVAGEYRPLLLVFDVIEVNGGSVGDRPRARWSRVDARHQAARRPNDPRPWQVPDLLLGRKTTRLMPAHTAMPPTSALWAAWALALRGEPMDLANFGGCSTVKRFWERSNRTAAVIRASANGSIDLSISAVASAPAPADTLWIVRGVRSLAAFRCGLSRGNQPAVKPAQLTLRQLVDILTRFEVLEDKRRGRCWSPTAYTPGDTTRANDGVAAVSALVFDMDRVPPDPDRLASVYWLGHATWSHTPTAPHRRVVIPLTTRVPAAHGRDVWQRARAALCPEADPIAIGAAVRHTWIASSTALRRRHQVGETRRSTGRLDARPLGGRRRTRPGRRRRRTLRCS